MTVNEIVDELRATRPGASDALRLQVLTLASRPPVAAPSLRERLRGRRPSCCWSRLPLGSRWSPRS